MSYQSQSGNGYSGIVSTLNFFGYTPSYSSQVNYSLTQNPSLNQINYSILEEKVQGNYSHKDHGIGTQYIIDLDKAPQLISENKNIDINLALLYHAGYQSVADKDKVDYSTSKESSHSIQSSYTTVPSSKAQIIIFRPTSFLNPNRPTSPFVDTLDEIQGFVRETYEKTLHKVFPEDLFQIKLCNEKELKQIYENISDEDFNYGIQGFCVNRFGHGISFIYVLKTELDALMLTLGHEIGHALSFPLQDIRNEEAKAYAFSLAWMETMINYNIGNLASHILPNPAKNNIHDVAFEFVMKLKNKGRKAMNIFRGLIEGLVSIE